MSNAQHQRPSSPLIFSSDETGKGITVVLREMVNNPMRYNPSLLRTSITNNNNNINCDLDLTDLSQISDVSVSFPLTHAEHEGNISLHNNAHNNNDNNNDDNNKVSVCNNNNDHDSECDSNTGNKQVSESVCPYTSSMASNISLQYYINRITKYVSCTSEALVISLVLLFIHVITTGIPLTPFNIHRRIITTIFIAAKIHDEDHESISYYSSVGGITPEEMKAMEIVFLKDILWNCWVSKEEYENTVLLLKNIIQLRVSSDTPFVSSQQLNETDNGVIPPLESAENNYEISAYIIKWAVTSTSIYHNKMLNLAKHTSSAIVLHETSTILNQGPTEENTNEALKSEATVTSSVGNNSLKKQKELNKGKESPPISLSPLSVPCTVHEEMQQYSSSTVLSSAAITPIVMCLVGSCLTEGSAKNSETTFSDRHCHNDKIYSEDNSEIHIKMKANKRERSDS
eukprot:Tbor_TRINITY_DN5570_c3_g7::TRINITY_DN5570_c3_g7_i1::g.13904::m.13904